MVTSLIKHLNVLRLALFVCLMWAACNAQAHTIRPAVVTVNFAADGEFAVTLRVSAELLLADIGPEYTDTNDSPNAPLYDELRALAPPELAARFAAFATEFLGELRMEFDGEPAALRYDGIDIPPVGDLQLSRDSIVMLSGTRPANATRMVWVWPAKYGSNVLRVAAGDLDSAISAWLQTGERSEPYLLDSVAERSRFDIITNYIRIGFEHIVPKGIDHILFVVGLFLLSLHLRPLLWQVSAFTLAHTITLGLSIYGLVSLPASVVEPLIALSIAYVGIENVFSSQLKPWRVLLVFMFGLLHGMGFASVLMEIGLPESEFLTALISFNVGVELGQLVVILAALALVGWCRNRDWYRSVVVVPGSLAISAVALYWTWDRIFG